MNQVRLHGDPFTDSGAANQLRSFLRLAAGNGVRCSLSLSGVLSRQPESGERPVFLTDGDRNWETATNLPSAEVDLIQSAVSESVSATAPVLVFCGAEQQGDVGQLVGFEWSDACAVMVAEANAAPLELLDRLRGELRWAGTESPAHALSESELRGWLELPTKREAKAFVHVSNDAFADGSDLVVEAFAQHFAESGLRLRLILPRMTASAVAMLRDCAGKAMHLIDVVAGSFDPEHVLDAAAIVMPFRKFDASSELVQALASGRPVCCALIADNAAILQGRGVAHRIGGRAVAWDAEHGAFFAPHPTSLVATMKAAAAECAVSRTGSRGRRHAIAELTTMRPASPPPEISRLGEQRPIVVLESPIFENSTSSEQTIEVAQALRKRGNVDVRLVPSTPFETDLAWLRERAPDLMQCLTRSPGGADLWLSSTAALRVSRPNCKKWALRVDLDNDGLREHTTSQLREDADLVVVHNENDQREVTSFGRSISSVKVIPHGLDGVMRDSAEPSQQVLDFKGNRPAVLFCSEMIWLAGFDVFLRAVLAARSAGHDFVVVVRTEESEPDRGFRELLDRFQQTPETPPVLRIGGDLSREEAASLYTACDVMLHPHRTEGRCMHVLEARACGLPVIATGNDSDDLKAELGSYRIQSSHRQVCLVGAHGAESSVLEPSAVDAGAQLLQVLETLSQPKQVAGRAASAIHSVDDWDSVAASLEGLVAEEVYVCDSESTSVEPVVVLPSMDSHGAKAVNKLVCA